MYVYCISTYLSICLLLFIFLVPYKLIAVKLSTSLFYKKQGGIENGVVLYYCFFLSTVGLVFTFRKRKMGG